MLEQRGPNIWAQQAHSKFRSGLHKIDETSKLLVQDLMILSCLFLFTFAPESQCAQSSQWGD